MALYAPFFYLKMVLSGR